MGVIVKICGLSTLETLAAALHAGADMVGFVHYPKSPRHVSLASAPALASRIAGRAQAVLLTVDADDEQLAAAVAAFRPDVLQLHGQETPSRVCAVRQKFGLRVIKAISLASSEDLAAATAYEALVDSLLFDARPPNETALPGGNGRIFDWSLLRGRSFRKPWLLGGGLTPENVAAAIKATGAPGVDVSSGVESDRGVKDIGKIADFIGKARGTEKFGPLTASG